MKNNYVFLLFMVLGIFGLQAQAEDSSALMSAYLYEMQQGNATAHIDKLIQAAELGEMRAQCILGVLYIAGKGGVVLDAQKGMEWIKKSVAQEHAPAEAFYAIYLKYDPNPDDVFIFNLLQKSIRHFELPRIKAWEEDGYNKKMENSYLDALYELGDLYSKGRGTTKDAAAAFRLYTKAAEMGEERAQNRLGDCYEEGIGTSRNITEAIKWYEKAAAQGLAEAQRALAWLYSSEKSITKDINKSMMWYRKAAEQGDLESIYKLGLLYVLQDEVKEGIYWLEKASEKGSVSAQHYLAKIYKDPEYGGDVEKMIYWYRKAAENGSVDAQYELGGIYNIGKYVKQNYLEAATWLNKAAKQGHSDAQNELGVLYFYGDGLAQSYAEALRWYTLSAGQDNAFAQCNLGGMYEKGQGVVADMAQAKAWYQKSAAQGNERAKENLAYFARLSEVNNNAEPLGFKLGKTMLSEVKKTDKEMKKTGISEWTGGEIYKSDGKVYEIEGLEEVLYIFDRHDRLDLVMLTMNKNDFDKINGFLKPKYSLVSEEIPYVGNKFVKYRQGNSYIIVEAMHMGFSMTVTYETTYFNDTFLRVKAEKERNKESVLKGKF